MLHNSKRKYVPHIRLSIELIVVINNSKTYPRLWFFLYRVVTFIHFCRTSSRLLSRKIKIGRQCIISVHNRWQHSLYEHTSHSKRSRKPLIKYDFRTTFKHFFLLFLHCEVWFKKSVKQGLLRPLFNQLKVHLPFDIHTRHSHGTFRLLFRNCRSNKA